MRRRILLIDDRKERRELLLVVLRASVDAECAAPPDPVSVGESLRDPKPAVIVLAHPCPWLPDFDLTHRVVAAFPGVPIVLLVEPHRADAHAIARDLPDCLIVPADPGAALQVRDAILSRWPVASTTPDFTSQDHPTTPASPIPRRPARLPAKDEAPTMLMTAVKRPDRRAAGQGGMTKDPNVVELDGARRQRGARERDEPEAATVRDILQSPARLEDILADLEGGSTVHFAPDEAEADCEALLEDVRRTLAVAIEESTAELSHGPLPVLPVPSNQIVQVLQILISNALKYRSEAAPRIHVRAERDGPRWELRIEDNGRGVSAAEQDRIFERFERGGDAEHVPGTGIGLSVCKRIIESHGGRIWVKPSPTGGSVFLFTVPVMEVIKQA